MFTTDVPTYWIDLDRDEGKRWEEVISREMTVASGVVQEAGSQFERVPKLFRSVFARLYGIRDRAAQISTYMEMLRIEYLRDKPIARLSSGEVTRLALCRALLNRPRLLLLDEPTAFLDARSALEVKKILLDLQRTSRTTIVYTSHNLLEVEEMCGRVMILSHGRMIASGTPVEVTQAILQEERAEPALLEAFLRIG